MNRRDWKFINGIRFRTYAYSVLTSILALLYSYHVISDDHIGVWHLLALAVSGLASYDNGRELRKIKKGHSHHDDLDRF